LTSNLGKFGGVRAKLAMLVVGSVLPLALVTGALLFIHYSNGTVAVKDASIHRVRAMASTLDREFTKIEAGLLVLGTAPNFATHDLPHFSAHALAALDSISVDSIVLSDKSGNIMLHNTKSLLGAIPPKLDKSALQDRILGTGRSAVSDLFRSGFSNGTPIIAVGVPMSIDGYAAYSLHAIIEPRRLSSILSEQKLPSNWSAAVIDSAGSVVVRSHNIEKFLGEKVNVELWRAMETSKEGAVETLTLEGSPVVTAYSRAPISHWTVTLSIPIAELHAPIRTGLVWLVATVLGALGFGLTLAWVIGGKISSSIRNLVGPARSLGMGLHVHVPKLNFREADEVGAALREAAITLEKSKFEAMHDALTGLSNRSAFNSMVQHQIAFCKRTKSTLAILYIDLDGFKSVNDLYGHACGDALLCEVAERLQAAIRGSDLAARLGGDEFALLLVQAEERGAIAFASKLIEMLSEPYNMGDIVARVSASIGVACGPKSNDNADVLLKSADKAMYRAKSLGKSRACSA